MLYIKYMSTQVVIRKLNKDVAELKDDVRKMKKFIFATFQDPEGEYRPEFVKRMKKAAKEKPTYQYTGRGSFLRLLKDK